MWTFYELKSRAKSVLRQSYLKSLLAVLICTLIGGGISLNTNTASVMSPDFSNIETAISNNLGLFSGLISGILVSSLLVSLFINLPLVVGQARFFNESARGKISLKEVFFPFINGLSNYLNIVKVSFFKALVLFLWGMLSFVVLFPVSLILGITGSVAMAGDAFSIIFLTLLIYASLIPMLIKIYQYFFVEYILADEPEIGWREALRKSKEMTKGNKLRMFLLRLSFVGWLLLGAVCLGIGVIFVVPYVQATFSELYLKLKDEYEKSDRQYVFDEEKTEEI